MNKHAIVFLYYIIFLFVVVGSEFSDAKVSPEEAKRLLPGGDLTPWGAEMAGNADGTIDAYAGGIQNMKLPIDLTQPLNGQHHPNPFADDKPLFRITAKNVDQYADRLSPGQLKLFELYPETFYMNVYQSRRTHGSPKVINDNTYQNALNGTLIEGGNGLANVYGGIPFPIAKNGLEAVWNHIARYRGQYQFIPSNKSTIVERDGSYTLTSVKVNTQYVYYEPNSSFEQLNNMLFWAMFEVLAPARIAGGSVLVYETLDQNREPRQAWTYNPGQRRVRRAPNLAYDATTNGISFSDEVDTYNGSPSRFNWRLLGKKEMFIPYNNFNLDLPEVTNTDEILSTVGHPNPEHIRYELHRVYVNEGALKPGVRHNYSKRVFYQDEDSWRIVIADNYDGSGKIWRNVQAMVKNYYEVPVTNVAFEAFHDLQSGRYQIQNMKVDERTTEIYTKTAPGKRFFRTSTLRRVGKQ